MLKDDSCLQFCFHNKLQGSYNTLQYKLGSTRSSMDYTQKKYMGYKNLKKNKYPMDYKSCNNYYNNNGCHTNNQNHQDYSNDNDLLLSYANTHRQMKKYSFDIDHPDIDYTDQQEIFFLPVNNTHRRAFEMSDKQ